MDVRSKKPEPFAQSEDQEDELLSIVSIKGGSKVVVGTQIGILSIFNRNAGWGDCVDRVPGHPHSIDALCNLPELAGIDTSSTVLTGSSDGFVRAVEILPTKLLGVVADHGEWPVERIAIGGGTSQLTLEDSSGSKTGNRVDDDAAQEEDGVGHGSVRWWVGSVGHEEVLRLTDLEAFLHEASKDGHPDAELDESGEQNEVEDVEENDDEAEPSRQPGSGEDSDSDESDAPKAKKRKRKPEKNPLAVKKKGKNSVDAESSFFNDL
ncbi:hypothetical protein H0H81_000027 [Sphagnurus paluster]|uniref:WD repeat-containing protein JIP5 n=1 Tax=Sphagnurus paluster TaxID=117069 RepID=A0A9P7G388_9AGAR|nr:hypothetical protein H0H81_000027 [Sphagnurus paluster]